MLIVLWNRFHIYQKRNTPEEGGARLPHSTSVKILALVKKTENRKKRMITFNYTGIGGMADINLRTGHAAILQV
jgi:hypothetical protein